MKLNKITFERGDNVFGSLRIIIFASVIISLSILTGFFAASGNILYAVPILALISIPLLARINPRGRFGILLVTPILVLAQMPGIHIPLGIPPVALILIVLTVFQLLLIISKRSLFYPKNILEFVPLLIFMLGGLITAIMTKEISWWYTASLIPVLLFFITANLIRKADDVWHIVRMVHISILIFIFLIWLANTTNHVISLSNSGLDWRWIGLGQLIQLGPVQFQLFSVTFGVLAGLGCPIAIALFFRKGIGFLWRIFYGLSLIIFVIIIGFTATRGAMIAAGVSSLIIIIAWIRFRPLIMLISIALVFLFIFINQDVILKFLPIPTIQRFLELQGNIFDVNNLRYRFDILSVTINNISINPLGVGYSYLWDRYGLDEAIAYSMLLSGTGIIGAIGYFLVMLQFLWRFLKSMRNGYMDQQYTLLTLLGIAIWIYGILVGFSTESFLVNSIHSFLFWSLLIPIYHGLNLLTSRQNERNMTPA